MTTICLVRHGQTEWNKMGRLQGTTDIPLNDLGFSQAEKCGQFLNRYEWDALISSPLQRARQTAEVINESLNMSIHLMDDFVERSFGDAEGMDLEERKEKFPDRKYPNEEPRDLFKNRIMAGINKIHKDYENQRVIVVAHGSVINHILEVITEGELGSGKSKIFNASINEIKFNYEKNNWQVVHFNVVEHLQESIDSKKLVLK